MPNVQQPKRSPEFVSGKQNIVTGIVPVQLFAVSWVNSSSEKSMALVLHFGKDTEDGGPGVFVMADETQMSEQLKIANATIKKGVRQYLARMAAPTAEEVPTGATTIMAEGQNLVVQSSPVPVINLGTLDGPPSVGGLDVTKLDIG